MVVDGGGCGLVFNQEDTQYRGIVASNEILTSSLQGMLARILAEKR
ncbi:MAG: hypothetical protein HYY81_08200 [Deltaproteobacteria bacterium]|nr:hypothetical protein [Deltaproteobacteria bacterium]